MERGHQAESLGFTQWLQKMSHPKEISVCRDGKNREVWAKTPGSHRRIHEIQFYESVIPEGLKPTYPVQIKSVQFNVFYSSYFPSMWGQKPQLEHKGIREKKKAQIKGKCMLRSVQFSLSVVSNSLRPHKLQHARPPCPSPTPGVHSDSCSLSRWYHPVISSSVVPFFSCPQSLPASKSFPMSQLFAWGSQRTGVSALTSFLPKKSQGWSPSEWTGWISLQSKALSRVSSNTTVQKHQFFSTQPSSQSNSHIHTWPQEKP